MTFADRLKELRKAATPGPWVAGGSIECAYGWIKAPPDCRDTFGRPYNILHSQYTSQPHDADLIAFLANNADAILELVRAAKPALESLEYAIRNMDERSYWEMMRGRDKPQKLTAYEAFKKALAKLNGEQT